MSNRLDISQQFYNDLGSFIRTKVENPEDANDILQDSLYKAHRNIHHLKDDKKFTSWLYQIIRNSIIDFYRKKRVNIDIDEIYIADEHTATDENDNQQLSNCLLSLISKLPDKYRYVLEISELGEMNQTEISRHLSLSISGTKSRIQRARKKLREIILDCCIVNNDKYGNIVEHECKNQNSGRC